MRQSWLRIVLGSAIFCVAIPFGAHGEEKIEARPGEHGQESHGPKFKKYTAHVDHKKHEFDLSNEDDKNKLISLLVAGDIMELEGVAPIENPMRIFWDLGLWAIVIFVLLLVILRKMAWGPMLEGLQKREETIKNSVEEAKKARADTERITAEFKVKMDLAYAEIPKIMDQARKEAEAFKEEMRNQTTKDIQTERQRLRREIDTARDQALQELWNQAWQLASLISAKAIGRSLTEEDHRRLLDEAIAEIGQSANRN